MGKIAGNKDAARVGFGQLFRDACGTRSLDEIIATTGLSADKIRAIRGGNTHEVRRDVHEDLLKRLLDAKWITTGHLGGANRMLNTIFQRKSAPDSRYVRHVPPSQFGMRM